MRRGAARRGRRRGGGVRAVRRAGGAVRRAHLEAGAARAHLDEDLNDLLDQLPVDLLALALLPYHLEHGGAHVALDGVEDNLVEVLVAHLLQLGEREALDVEAVEVPADGAGAPRVGEVCADGPRRVARNWRRRT